MKVFIRYTSLLATISVDMQPIQSGLAATTILKGETMNLLKHRSLRFYLGFFLILTMAVGGSAIAAFADSGTGANVSVNAGNLTESGPTTVSATPVTLSGDDQTTSYALGLTV